MDIFADIKKLIITTLCQLQSEGILPIDLDFSNITVEPPRDSLHGDIATNAAMVLAKPAKKNPREIADVLAAKLSLDSRIISADVAGPGFLNLRLDPLVWTSVIPTVLKLGANYGRSKIGAGQKVNIEYVSANPTGPLHVGHARGAVFGDALASLLDFSGYDVTREYYVNDGGSQIDVLARSVYLRYLEAHGQKVSFEDGIYPGDYLIEVGQALKDKVGDVFVDVSEDVWLEEIRVFSIEAMMQLIRVDLALLGIKMDVFYFESSLYSTNKIDAAIEKLSSVGLIYEGVLPPPKGKLADDWEAREQTLFKSTDYGDDVDRPIKKSDGSWTYFAPDIAYHFDKIERGFVHLINVFGADHGGYVKRLKSVVGALSNGRVSLDVKLTQLVKLLKNGEPFKMSKRAGNFITLRDLIEKVGSDVTRFVMLTRKNDIPMDFDFDKVLEQSKDNPVFYVQYAHARIHSVFLKAAENGIEVANVAAIADVTSLKHANELSLIKKIAEWPRLLELAAKHNEPHRIAFYLYELSGEFHSLWNAGKDIPEIRFLQVENQEASAAKFALLLSTQTILVSGLGILGVSPMDEMR